VVHLVDWQQFMKKAGGRDWKMAQKLTGFGPFGALMSVLGASPRLTDARFIDNGRVLPVWCVQFHATVSLFGLASLGFHSPRGVSRITWPVPAAAEWATIEHHFGLDSAALTLQPQHFYARADSKYDALALLDGGPAFRARQTISPFAREESIGFRLPHLPLGFVRN
jgi:hypothetical protein